MTAKQSLMGVACGVLTCALLSCGGGSSKSSGSSTTSESEMQLNTGVDELETGDAEAARAQFARLAADPEVGCRARYGRSLAVAQQAVQRLDMLSDAAGLLLGGILGSIPWRAIDVVIPSESLLADLETWFEESAQDLDFVVAHGCTLTVPKGVPFEVGSEGGPVDLRLRVGYEFDPAAARGARVAYEGALAGLRLARAHRWQMGELEAVVEPVLTALRDGLPVEVIGPGQASQQTMIRVLRTLAGVMANDPQFLTLRDDHELDSARQHAYTAVRTFYSRDGDVEEGVVRELERQADHDENPRDDAVALDDANGNGRLDRGDMLMLGVRELHIGGVFGSESIADGIGIRLTEDVADVGAVVDAAQQVAQIVAAQLRDDAGDSARPRLGLRELNTAIRAVSIPDFHLETLPEAVELDLRAFFDNPRGLREFLPYRIDDDGDPSTPPVFLLEGENWGTSPAEEWISFGDAPHFEGDYTAVGDDGPMVLDRLRIPADGVAPPLRSIVAPLPLPYAAYPDPTLDGVLYVNLAALPADLGYEPTAGFAPATLYSANKVAAAYAAIVLRQGLFFERGLIGGRELFGSDGLLHDQRLVERPDM